MVVVVVRESQALRGFDEHGCFMFGGSTVMLLFQAGVLTPDTDLLRNSCRPVCGACTYTCASPGLSIHISPPYWTD